MIHKLRQLNNSRDGNCILHITNEGVNQTEKSGSAVLGKVFFLCHSRKVMFLTLVVGVIILGGCKDKSTDYDLSQKPVDYEGMSALAKMRYGRSLQSELQKDVKSLKKLNVQDLNLILPPPDFTRQDGREFMAQYRGQDCVMDVFWKKNKTIHHYEIRQRRSVLNGAQEVTDPVDWQCIQQIMSDA